MIKPPLSRMFAVVAVVSLMTSATTSAWPVDAVATGQPSITVRPSHGRPGSKIVARGAGFSAGAHVTLGWAVDSTVFAATEADAHGRFSASFTIPDAMPGDYDVVAAAMSPDGTNNQTSARLTIDENPNAPTPTSAELATSSASSPSDTASAAVEPSATTLTTSVVTPSATGGNVNASVASAQSGTFTAEADARVVESAPTTNYGSSTFLEVDGKTRARIQSYVRFTVSGIGLPFTSAILRLHVTGNGGSDGPWVLPANNNWKESAITWATSPPTWSHPTADLGVVPANSWVSFDVTSLVTKNGQYTFKLATDSVGGIEFSSRETLQPPQLLINMASPVASVTPSAPTPSSTRTPTPSATAKSTPSSTPTALATETSASVNPFEGATFYIDPASSANAQANAWRSTRPSDATEMDKIASQPEADWFDGGSGDIATAIDRRVSTISAAGALPVLVAYNIPKRDCDRSGAPSPLSYQTWIRAFAAAIGTREAIVILEPDALANIGCLSASDQSTRVALIHDAVSVLEAQAGVSVYIDAGHSNWVSASVMAGLLTKAGIDQAQGFSLNVASFGATSDNIAYGRDLSARIGGKHFIIDTSRNGLGPAPDAQWCNPPGRALGPAPTAATSDPLVDAYFWIKRPGESDGTCNGGPVAGLWWADYALGLAKRTP